MPAEQDVAAPDPTGPLRPSVRVRVDPKGPTYVEGPVELCVDGQEPVLIDRFTVAICACRRSRRYPLCDNSHVQEQASRLSVSSPPTPHPPD